MNEVEKMYENANIKAKEYCGDDYIFEAMLEVECTESDKEKCKTCNERKVYYPPFTAEKQLSLIKWLGELDMLEIMRTTREDKAWIINSEYGMSGNVYKHTSRMKSFEETLAKLINSLWQDLSEEERKQIKEILE